jgi:hypothetical protein
MRSRIPRALLSGGARGDLDRLRQIASDPRGFILQQGWVSLDFREEEHAARLAKLLESLETEILSVLEATNQLRASPELELYELTTKNPEMFDEVVSKQTTLLEKEIIDLKNEADQLSKEIAKLTTERQPGEEIVS